MKGGRLAFRYVADQHTDALLAARASMVDGADTALDSLHRLARALAGVAQTYGQDEVAAAAQRLQSAGADRARMAVDALLAELRRAAGRRPRGDAGLVIDDDTVARTVLSGILEAHVRTVHQAASLTEARELLRQHQVGLVVLDIQLEDGDGRDFLAELRGDRSLDAVPIVVFTSHEDLQVRTECLALGANEVHTKPLDAFALEEAFAALTGHDDRTSLAILGNPATGFADRKMLEEAVDGSGRAFAQTQKIWVLLVFAPRDPGSTWTDEERTKVVEAMQAEFAGTTELLARAGDRLVALIPNCDAPTATLRAHRVMAAVAPLPVAAGGTEGGATDFLRAWPSVRRVVALSQGVGEPVVVDAPREDLNAPSVLLVDDDQMIVMLVRAALAQDGLHVAHVSDGSHLHNVIDQLRPRLILLDVQLPGLSGYELLEQLQHHPGHRRIPVAMLTAQDHPRHEALGLDLGALDHITKPFEPLVLRARVKRILRMSSRR